MNLLLDTHVLLWWLADDPCLGEDARAAIADPGNGIWVSAASAWEVAIKKALGRLSLAAAAARGLPMALAENDFSPLPISLNHALAVADLPRLLAQPSLFSSSTSGVPIFSFATSRASRLRPARRLRLVAATNAVWPEVAGAVDASCGRGPRGDLTLR